MGNKKKNPRQWLETFKDIIVGIFSGVISGLLVWLITK